MSLEKKSCDWCGEPLGDEVFHEADMRGKPLVFEKYLCKIRFLYQQKRAREEADENLKKLNKGHD